MRTEEYIICAAIHVQNGFKESTIDNIKDGIIVCGRRHSDCYNILKGIIGDFQQASEYMPNRDHQGFVTSTNRYVGRAEAYQIALKAGQIEPRKIDTLLSEWEQKQAKEDYEILTSEDLY